MSGNEQDIHPPASGGANTGAGSSITLKPSDADAIAAISGVDAVSPIVSGTAQVIAGALNWSRRVQAVTPAYLAITAWTISQAPRSLTTTTRMPATWQ